jgi:proline dehydrogenase
MRFFEFVEDDAAEQLVIVLRNYIGRSASKKAPAKLNWAGLNKILKTNGFDYIADYETFKAMYDSSTAIQNMVKNFNQDGVELNVPGAPDAEKEPTQDGQSSQEKVDQMAASAAPQQLAQQTATPQL